jgi:hypothetical protein
VHLSRLAGTPARVSYHWQAYAIRIKLYLISFAGTQFQNLAVNLKESAAQSDRKRMNLTAKKRITAKAEHIPKFGGK